MSKNYHLKDLIGQNYVIACENLEQVKHVVDKLISIGYKCLAGANYLDVCVYVYEDMDIIAHSECKLDYLFKQAIPYASISDFQEKPKVNVDPFSKHMDIAKEQANVICTNSSLPKEGDFYEGLVMGLFTSLSDTLQWCKIDADKLPEGEVLALRDADNEMLYGFLTADAIDTLGICCASKNDALDRCTHYLPESTLLNLTKEI